MTAYITIVTCLGLAVSGGIGLLVAPEVDADLDWRGHHPTRASTEATDDGDEREDRHGIDVDFEAPRVRAHVGLGHHDDRENESDEEEDEEDAEEDEEDCGCH
jgi:hypothetical protein